MYSYIIGKVTDVNSNNIVLECNNIGYLIYVPNLFSYQIDNEYKVFVYNKIAEDDFINIDENSWLSISYTGVGWTITKFIGYNGYAITWLGGFINPYETSAEYEIKPVFYLLSSVEYVSGTGTKSDPYRIS